MGQGAAAQRQKFQTIIELGRVAAIFLDDRENFLEIIAEQLRGQHTLARMHPVFIAAQGIDLTVVNKIAIGMRPSPAGKRIGAEA